MIFIPTERPILRLDAEDVDEIEKLNKDDWSWFRVYEYLAEVWIAILFLMLRQWMFWLDVSKGKKEIYGFLGRVTLYCHRYRFSNTT
jgi:hypothetical protein